DGSVTAFTAAVAPIVLHRRGALRQYERASGSELRPCGSALPGWPSRARTHALAASRHALSASEHASHQYSEFGARETTKRSMNVSATPSPTDVESPTRASPGGTSRVPARS